MTDKPGYVRGLNELIRANRLYTGLSQPEFAKQLGVREQTVSDIEIGRRPAPEGYLDSVEDVVRRFDSDVNEVVKKANFMLKEAKADPDQSVDFRVYRDSDGAYMRAVVGRAAVISGLIFPILEGSDNAIREADPRADQDTAPQGREVPVADGGR